MTFQNLNPVEVLSLLTPGGSTSLNQSLKIRNSFLEKLNLLHKKILTKPCLKGHGQMAYP